MTVRDARALAAGLADEGLRIVSGGTDSHLILADLRPLGIEGKTAEAVAPVAGSWIRYPKLSLRQVNRRI